MHRSDAPSLFLCPPQNGTLYIVNVVTSDIFYNSQLYNADLKTVDLTPPVFVTITQ